MLQYIHITAPSDGMIQQISDHLTIVTIGSKIFEVVLMKVAIPSNLLEEETFGKIAPSPNKICESLRLRMSMGLAAPEKCLAADRTGDFLRRLGIASAASVGKSTA